MIEELHFYFIEDDFIAALRGIDSRVQHNYGGTRPYLGILLTVQSLKYFAPLSSYKPKQDKLNNITVFKMHERGTHENKLGVIHLHNMFPVLEDKLIPIEIDLSDHYGILLNNQYEYILTKKELLQKQAQRLYSIVNRQRIQGEVTSFTKVCCDFKLLEKFVKGI